MPFKAEVRGADKVKERLRELAKEYPEAAKKAIYAEAQVIMAEAVQQTPVDTGRLRASAYVKPEDEHGKTTVALGFGAEYALAVHERVEVPHAEGTGSKFLSRPVDAHRASFGHDVAERIKEEVGGE